MKKQRRTTLAVSFLAAIMLTGCQPSHDSPDLLADLSDASDTADDLPDSPDSGGDHVAVDDGSSDDAGEPSPLLHIQVSPSVVNRLRVDFDTNSTDDGSFPPSDEGRVVLRPVDVVLDVTDIPPETNIEDGTDTPWLVLLVHLAEQSAEDPWDPLTEVGTFVITVHGESVTVEPPSLPISTQQTDSILQGTATLAISAAASFTGTIEISHLTITSGLDDQAIPDVELPADQCPVRSGPQSLIAYKQTPYHNSMDRGQICVIRSDGTGFRSLTDSIPKRGPFWSPDGRYLAYDTVHYDNRHVYVIDVESGATTCVSLVRHLHHDVFGSWSPDSQLIVTDLGDIYSIADPGQPIFTLPLSGTCYYGMAEGPFWSPSGSELALCSSGMVYLVAYPSGTPEILPISTSSSLHWSPTGDKLLWASAGELTLFSLSSDTEVALQVSSGFHFLGLHSPWSPDGEQVAFSCDPTASNTAWQPRQVGVVNLDTLDVIWLNDNSMWCGRPSWSPDGKYIVYESEEGLYVVPADGSEEPTRIPGTDNGALPAWCPVISSEQSEAQLPVALDTPQIVSYGYNTFTGELYARWEQVEDAEEYVVALYFRDFWSPEIEKACMNVHESQEIRHTVAHTGQQCILQVTARGGGSASPPSEAVLIQIPPPGVRIANAEAGDHAIWVEWEAARNAEYYRVEWRPERGGDTHWRLVPSSGDTSLLITDVDNDVPYCVTVAAVTAGIGSDSDASETVYGLVPRPISGECFADGEEMYHYELTRVDGRRSITISSISDRLLLHLDEGGSVRTGRRLDPPHFYDAMNVWIWVPARQGDTIELHVCTPAGGSGGQIKTAAMTAESYGGSGGDFELRIEVQGGLEPTAVVEGRNEIWRETLDVYSYHFSDFAGPGTIDATVKIVDLGSHEGICGIHLAVGDILLWAHSQIMDTFLGDMAVEGLSVLEAW